MNVSQCSFQRVRFQECKMVGILFEQVNPFSLELSFDDCNLSQCSFYNLNLSNILFKSCLLQEVDFTETNLTKANFTNSDLTNAIFVNTNLEKASLIGVSNFQINPETNKIKGLKIENENLAGLLAHYNLDII
jgi:uncharacterized protein YjbI with pentapeptide repeats